MIFPKYEQEWAMSELMPVAVLVLALLIDWSFGDLPNSLHPVVAMSIGLLGLGEKR